uniref:Uncharacterized protein n=1 Tax=Oryza barthii TaxID=65489 RepID=A0A0D3HRI4_9ORYZ
MVPRIGLLVVLVGLAFQAILHPPPQKLCGSPGGPPVTSPRIKLSDRRHAYKEGGELVDELGIYLLAFDRAGYGENYPNPKRNLRSEALDIEELTDQLKLGQKFCVGNVDGRIPNLGCLQYIPNRLAGAALVLPIINYWWPSSPAELSRQAFMGLIMPEQRTLWIAHNINFLALPLVDPEVAPFFCGSHASS